VTKPRGPDSGALRAVRGRANDLKWRRKDPLRALLMSKKRQCKMSGVPFDEALMLSIPIPDTCPALGTKISVVAGHGHRSPRETASYDQIIPGRGYVVGNVVVLSKMANLMKSSATPAELLRFAEWVIGEYGYLLDTAPPVDCAS
jgi:hypothetical protein